jgi:hypothetical protein
MGAFKRNSRVKLHISRRNYAFLGFFRLNDRKNLASKGFARPTQRGQQGRLSGIKLKIPKGNTTGEVEGEGGK